MTKEEIERNTATADYEIYAGNSNKRLAEEVARRLGCVLAAASHSLGRRVGCVQKCDGWTPRAPLGSSFRRRRYQRSTMESATSRSTIQFAIPTSLSSSPPARVCFKLQCALYTCTQQASTRLSGQANAPPVPPPSTPRRACCATQGKGCHSGRSTTLSWNSICLLGVSAGSVGSLIPSAPSRCASSDKCCDQATHLTQQHLL